MREEVRGEVKQLVIRDHQLPKNERDDDESRGTPSMIGLRVKTTVDIVRQLRKCTGYMLLSLVYPASNSTKLAAFVVRHSAGRKRAGSRDR